ncbi:MAG: hypothetical protein ACI808_000969 [Paraglaciecola sp.]|jgi:hypothetical protein
MRMILLTIINMGVLLIFVRMAAEPDDSVSLQPPPEACLLTWP